MKKLLIYLGIMSGLSLTLAVVSRLSAEFSEWYASNIYPLLIATVGRFFGLVPFAVGEFYLIFFTLCAVAGITLMIVKLIKSKGERRRVLAVSALLTGCIVSTMFMQYLLTCGINYNRMTFLHREYTAGTISFERSAEDELRVFLSLMAEFDEIFYDLENQLEFDEDGIFVQTTDVTVTAPKAMANLAQTFEQLNVHYPRPKPVSLFAELMSDAFIIGMYFPFTMEANFNSISPDSERGVTALHELVHLAGFMREDEANFISFLAGRESGDLELMYSAYLFAIDMIVSNVTCAETFWEMQELIPDQFRRDWDAQRNFWLSRLREVDYIFDDHGEVVDFVITEDPFAGAIQDASSSLNDLWLWSQGQEGTVSYSRMVDLLFATELARISQEENRN
jgi:hypothetical protein